MGAAERLGPALGKLGSKAAAAVGGAARGALPIAGETLGAGALVIATQNPAGESEADLAKTRAIDSAGRQHMAAAKHPSERSQHTVFPDQHTAFPDQHVDAGPNHTTLPAHIRTAQDGIVTTPAEPQTKPAHTGHARLDIRELTKPTGTTIHQPSAADEATLAKREKIVTPAHAAHLTPSGTLVNADKAIIDVDNKVNGRILPESSPCRRHAQGSRFRVSPWLRC